MTVQQLLKGQRPKTPALLMPYIQAAKLIAPSTQPTLGF